MDVRNGYFKVSIREMGSFLQIFPPENGGKPLELRSEERRVGKECM